MKKLRTILSVFVLMLSCQALSAQLSCPGALYSDDFSSVGAWQTLGTTNAASGNISITGGEVLWDQFTNRRNRRILLDADNFLPNSNLWRIEWEFNMDPSNVCVGADIMAVTSDTAHPRFAMPGVNSETDQNTVEVLVGSPNCNANSFYFFVSSKLGTARNAGPSNIPFTAGVDYYLRLQRTSPAQCVLSVFTDAARTIHHPGSPLCFTVDQGIDDLRYLQMGLWTSASSQRIITAHQDNLCIYDNVTNDGCEETICEAEPMIDVQIDPQTCIVTFTDNTTFGTGTTPLANFPIVFGDGTTGQLTPGGSISHYYPSGEYEFCVYIFTYDQRYECCRFEFCDRIQVECAGGNRSAGSGTGSEVAPIEKVQLYPNPGNQMVNLRSEKAIQSLRIYDSSGRVVRTENGLDQNSLELNLENLTNGIYFFEINLGDEVVTEKFSKIQ